MAVSDTPVFAQTPQNGTIVVTTLMDNVDDDSPTNVGLIVTAGSNGALVTKITAMPRGTVTATSLDLFFSPDGTEMRLIEEAVMAAHTLAATTASPKVSFDVTPTSPIRLQAGELLYVGIGVSLTNGMVFYAEWTDL